MKAIPRVFVKPARSSVHDLDELPAPRLHAFGEPVEAAVIGIEVLRAEPAERPQRVGEHPEVEAGILLGPQLKQTLVAEAAEECLHVEEVPRLGPAEKGEHLVGGQLLQRQHPPELRLLGGEEPGVVGQVDLTHLVGNRGREADEAVHHPLALDDDAVTFELGLQGGEEHGHGGWIGGEIIQVAGPAIHDAPHGEAAGARQRDR